MFVVPKTVQAGVNAAISGVAKQISALAGLTPEGVRSSSFAELARKAGKTVENFLKLESPRAKQAVQNARSEISQKVA